MATQQPPDGATGGNQPAPDPTAGQKGGNGGKPPPPPPPPNAGGNPPPPPPEGVPIFLPTPPPPPPPPNVRLVTPYNRYGMYEKMSLQGNKRFGGLAGDASALNWILAVGRIAAGVCVIVFAQSFFKAFGEGIEGARDYSTGYYMSQYSLGLAVLILVFTILYTGWTWLDSRHPMRKAHEASLRGATNMWNANPNNFGNVVGLRTANGRKVKVPGLMTSRLYDVKRMTLSRLFAERRHIMRLLWIYLIFTVLCTIPFLVMTFKSECAQCNTSVHVI